MGFAIHTLGPEETEGVGEAIGEAAVPGLLVTLSGELGAGKTRLTKGIARGLGVPRPEYVSSPTFTIHKVYRGRLTLNHLDFYRLTSSDELEGAGLEDTLSSDGVSVVEWPDNFYPALGTDRLDVKFSITSEESRELDFSWRGPIGTAVGEALLTRFVDDGRVGQ